MTFFSVFQCEFFMSVECMSADPQMFVCVCVYGQGFYFGQAPVNDIKSVGVTVAKTEKREDCL